MFPRRRSWYRGVSPAPAATSTGLTQITTRYRLCVPSLASCDLRVDRAQRRLEELQAHVLEYAQQHAASCAIKVTSMAVSMQGWPPQPPLDIGITAGEVAYNLRAALDYLVFELAVLDSGEANMRTQFPIETSPDGFEARKKPHKSGAPNWLTGVSHEHCGMIEMLQPCNGVNWIEFLRDLSNEDKHRTIPVFGYAGAGTINVGGTDEEVAAMGGYRIPGDEDSVYFPSSISVTFNSEPPVLVGETLQTLVSEVRGVVDLFRPDFSSGNT